VSPDRLASRARRRELSLCGALPRPLAVRFTEGERAVLAIVAAEVKAKGACDLSLEAIAARAGVCVTLARDAIRHAAAGGLALVIERRRHGRPSLTNVVRIVSRDWLAWIWRGGGSKTSNPTNTLRFKQPNCGVSPNPTAKKAQVGDGEAGRQAEDGREASSIRLAKGSR
jgi:hypothetical protein